LVSSWLVNVSLARTSYTLTTEFLTGFLSYYKIVPTQTFMSCFNEFTSEVFLLWIQSVQAYAESLQTGSNSYVDTQYEYLQTGIGLNKAFDCVSNTTEFQQFLIKVQNNLNSTEFRNKLGLYFQSYIPEWVQLSQPAFSAFRSQKMFQAGLSYAGYFPSVLTNSSSSFVSYAQLRAFYNGIFAGLSLPSPRDSIYCYNQTNSLVVLSFYKSWAEYISKNVEAFTQNTMLTKNYFSKQGKEIYTQIPLSVLNCLQKSTDSKTLMNHTEFGFDPYEQSFQTLLFNYIASNSRDYSNFLEATSLFLNHYYPLTNFLEAGFNFGNLLNSISPLTNKNQLKGKDIFFEVI